MLKDVIYVPRFSYELVSVSCLLQNTNLSINFSGKSCIIQDKLHSMMIGRDECCNGLYMLSDKSFSTCSVVVCSVSLATWHHRLGHLSSQRLYVMKDLLCFSNIDMNPYHVCPLAKERRLSFPFHNNVTNSVFDLVHCDIWGTFKVPTYNGHKYFLTLVDDASRYTWTYLMHNKSDVVSIVPRFFELVHTQFSKTIKVFRSDNALELLFKDFFASKGTIHQFSCVERPQQNSVVERKHQHLLNVARALFFQSRVLIRFWGDCILSASFLVNRTPAPLLQNKAPFQILYNQKVEYSYFRVFGCLALASTLDAHRSKFDPRACICVFIGYPPSVKGYKLHYMVKR